MQRENHNLGDYGPQLFSVASDSPMYWQPGKKATAILFQIQIILLAVSGITPRQKEIFRESIFLWEFEIQICNNEEIIVTAADVVVDG